MHVLVTGAAGFIGTEVVRALVADGHRVRGLDALMSCVHTERRDPEMLDAMEFVHGDVRDPDTVSRALRGVDVVCHQAAMVGRGKEIWDAPTYASTNDFGTAVVLAKMAEAGVHRLVLASSIVIYGECRNRCAEHGLVRPPARVVEDLDAGRFELLCPECRRDVTPVPLTETDLPDPPRNVYAVTKLAQEYLADAWVREIPGQVVALRYHNVYGPRMAFDTPYSGVAAAFRSRVEAGEAPVVFEDGGSRRDFVHVRDIARANAAAVRFDAGGKHAFNIASGDPRPILDVARSLADATGAPQPWVSGRYRVGDVRHQIATPQRAVDELGWRPEVGFDEGMKEFATTAMRDR